MLGFADIRVATPLNHVFDVYIEGSKVLSNYVIVDEAGGYITSHVEEFRTTVRDGFLSIKLHAKAGWASVNAIGIYLLSNEVSEETPTAGEVFHAPSQTMVPSVVASVSPTVLP